MGQARSAILDARRFVTEARAPRAADEQQGFSPQRRWVRASLRAYFASGRDSAVMLRDFDRRVRRGRQTASIVGMARTGRFMLELFATLDAPESMPRVWIRPASERPVGRHTLSFEHDLVYDVPDGYLIRELWTDSTLRSRNTNFRLMVTAAYLHAEQEYGVGRVREVQVWHLRDAVQLRWARAELDASTGELLSLLDQVAAALQ